jgi:hypothetical protein
MQSDGTYQTVISAASVNYQDVEGNWHPIDDSIVPSKTAGFAYHNAANRFDVQFPGDLSKGVVKYQLGSDWLTFALASAQGVATPSDNTVAYTDPTSGTIVSYTVNSDILKESVTFADAAAAHALSYDVAVSAGVSLRALPNGETGVFGSDGSMIAAFAPPTMQDSTASSDPQPLAISLTRASADAGSLTATPDANANAGAPAPDYTLTFTPDQAWLDAPASANGQSSSTRRSRQE